MKAEQVHDELMWALHQESLVPLKRGLTRVPICGVYYLVCLVVMLVIKSWKACAIVSCFRGTLSLYFAGTVITHLCLLWSHVYNGSRFDSKQKKCAP